MWRAGTGQRLTQVRIEIDGIVVDGEDRYRSGIAVGQFARNDRDVPFGEVQREVLVPGRGEGVER